MDDWTYPHPDPDSCLPEPALLDQDWRAIEDHHVQAHQAEAARRASDLEETEALESVGDPQTVSYIPLPFATPPGVALTF
jgi:hypothetical protein